MAVESVIEWRVGAVERKAQELDQKKADNDVVMGIADEVRGLRKTLIGFVIGTASSAIIVALSVIYAVAQQH